MTRALSKREGVITTPADLSWWRKSVPCQAACPTYTDIPAYLAAIYRGAFEDAYTINVRDNVFPDILGRVCTRPCEHVCRHGETGLGDSVAICAAKRSSGDHRGGRAAVVLPDLFGASGKQVAVVGGGVAGLTCARELTRCGHQVTLYEASDLLGGMAALAIPSFRLPGDSVRRETEQATLSGFKVVSRHPVSDAEALRTLCAEMDAVIMATGAPVARTCGCEGEALPAVISGLRFLMDTNRGIARPVGKQVVVIGGGFTAVDCARVALRQGAGSVTLMYRRERKHMALTPGEYEELVAEGARTIFRVAPLDFRSRENGGVLARFAKTSLTGPSGEGLTIDSRPAMEIAADTVIVAVGQEADLAWVHEACAGHDGGPRETAPLVHHCGANVFLAGDCSTGPRSLIEAIAHARRCAVEVDTFLHGALRLSEALEVTTGRDVQRPRELDALPRRPMPALPPHQRGPSDEVETGHSCADAQTEASRCYLCHYKYEIDMDACIYCDLCCKVKPRANCIIKSAGFYRDQDSAIEDWDPLHDDFDAANQFEYHINPADCIRCNACAEICPVNCITVQKVSRVVSCETVESPPVVPESPSRADDTQECHA